MKIYKRSLFRKMPVPAGKSAWLFVGGMLIVVFMSACGKAPSEPAGTAEKDVTLVDPASRSSVEIAAAAEIALPEVPVKDDVPVAVEKEKTINMADEAHMSAVDEGSLELVTPVPEEVAQSEGYVHIKIPPYREVIDLFDINDTTTVELVGGEVSEITSLEDGVVLKAASGMRSSSVVISFAEGVDLSDGVINFYASAENGSGTISLVFMDALRCSTAVEKDAATVSLEKAGDVERFVLATKDISSRVGWHKITQMRIEPQVLSDGEGAKFAARIRDCHFFKKE